MLNFLVALVLIATAIFSAPSESQAIYLHNFSCNNCHAAGVSLYTSGNSNLCTHCHRSGGDTVTTSDGRNGPLTYFDENDLSNAMGSHDAINADSGPSEQTSHTWVTFRDVLKEAGATGSASYSSRYGASTGKITCSKCHNPHATFVGTPGVNAPAGSNKALRLNDTGDAVCQDCHLSWYVSPAAAVETHPVGMLLAGSSVKASISDPRVELVNDGSNDLVSCSSCHNVHWSDSDSSTTDGRGGNHSTGDGNLLVTDGPLRSIVGDREGTAQLRSNLCQACHTYALHGRAGDDDARIGCLDCHGGHSYNGGVPNAYVLNRETPDAVPTRLNAVLDVTKVVSWSGQYPVTGDPKSTRYLWADEWEGSATGYCEQCHGDVNADPIKSMTAGGEHTAGDSNDCTVCHNHSEAQFSFAVDASAATCGACHGFPPYKNVPGDRDLVPANDGGYAENNSGDAGTPYDYLNDSGHFKDETTTGHKVHAGADLPTPPAYNIVTNPELQWYFVGLSGLDNCKVCHGPQAGTSAGNHRDDPTTNTATFRDVWFDGVAQTGGLIPSYDWSTTFTCDNVYCHTNGAPYNGASRPNRDYTTTHTTPPWVGDGSSYAAGGYGAIFLQADRCAKCHGNDVATMFSQSNTPAHMAHLGGSTTLDMGITFDCVVCHANTAADADTLVAGAMDGRTGGKHVNGAIDIDFQTGAVPNTLPEALSSSIYTAADGVCNTYCHDVTGDPGAFFADWDISTDMQCDSCHGGLNTDSAGDGGYGPITTGSHTRHVDVGSNGPELSCDECHGTGATLGTHSGHINGNYDILPPVDGVTFADLCQECHGYDSETGEVVPVWGNSTTTDCATCHAGSKCGADFNSMSPADLQFARQTGHNRLTGSGAYPSGNAPANADCVDCHVADSPNHWDGSTGTEADKMLRADIGFPATYAGNENSYCDNCHGTSPAHPTHIAAKVDINSHQSKLCVACHNVHGDSLNRQMIWRTQTEQLNHDPSATGKYGATVVEFTATTGANSYDEDDGGDGGVTESNGDDICATCHSSAAGTAHNNIENTDSKAPTGHYMGEDCFTCHATHADATDAFKVGVGTACNDCHGFPPATGAHVRHSQSSSNDKDVEDISDCAYCHTGADSYTYDLNADIGNLLNHSDSAGRKTILTGSVGYNATNLDCATACHTSTVANGGRWTDTTGLDCDACHSVASGGNLSTSHDEHLDAGKLCTDCHTLDDGATPVAGPLNHIDDTSGGDEGPMYQGMATALNDEAAVTRASMTFDDPNNTCSGSGVAAGCHATGTPDWDVAIPADSSGCVLCHTDTDTASFNPTSGLHDNNPSGPTVTANSHDGNFDDGSAGTADCVTCHTSTPSGTHIDGNLDTGAAVTVDAVAGYTQATGTCTTTCHSAGTVWSYKWSTSAYNSDGTECANCHGDYVSGWTAGVIHETFPTRGNKHNNVGSLSYPCLDCHAIGSQVNPNYAFTLGTHDWNENAAETSHHGDGFITMNDSAANDFVADNGAPNNYAGCTTGLCHQNDDAHSFPQTATTFSTNTVVGDDPEVLCSGCHGGTSAGGDILGYWPDDSGAAVDDTTEDNAGAHAIHVTAIATKFLGQADLTELLSDTAGSLAPFNTWSADEKQLHLCAFCHGAMSADPYSTVGNPLSDGTHGSLSDLPAEVLDMRQLWDGGADGDSSWDAAGNGSCANVNCHNNQTTPVTNEWYDTAGNSACVMCHVDVTDGSTPSSNGGTHVAHTSAATNFGRSISCDDCHRTAAETVAWGTPGTPPTNGHIDGSFSVSSNQVSFTYTSGEGCGTNECHNAGDGTSAPASGATSYPWGTALADCNICHNDPPGGGASVHGIHVASTDYVPNGCDECHPSETDATHIQSGALVQFASAVSGPADNSSFDGSCANNCHLAGDAGDWNGGSSAIGCTDCHSGSYTGGNNWRSSGNNYLPQYNMHTVTPITSGKVHTDALVACNYCHDSISGLGTHVNGVWTADDADNSNDQDRGLFAAFTDATTPSCSGTGVNQANGCHLDDGAWARLWGASAGVNDETRCANCHGDYSGWRSGVVHTENAARGNTTHTGVGNLTYECSDCHVIGATTGNYTFTDSTNDWNFGTPETSHHGNNFLEINDNTAVHARNTGRAGCTGCHEGATGTPNDHDFPVSAWTVQPLTGDEEAAAAGCTSCHGGTNSYPDSSPSDVYPDRAGAHAEHMVALLAQPEVTQESDACTYCHPGVPGEGGHGDNVAPADMHAVGGFKQLIGGGSDSGSTFNTAYVNRTCSGIDCHSNASETPHWYGDNELPGSVTIAASAGTEPGSVTLSWTAQGDDGNRSGTAYHYDVRYSSGAITSGSFDTDPEAGDVPVVNRQGETETMVVKGLDPGMTYNFAVITHDEAGNASPMSNVVSRAADTDTTAPTFWGVTTAMPGCESGDMLLFWAAAEDHSMPIDYTVYYDTGSIDYGGNDNIVTTKSTSMRLTGLPPGVIYNFAVRATDATGTNTDDNTFVKSAKANTVLGKPVNVTTYYAGGAASGGVVTTTTGTWSSQQAPVAYADNTVFAGEAGTAYASDTDIAADSFKLYFEAGNGGSDVVADIGYYDGAFTPLASSPTVNVGSRAKRVVTFKFSGAGGLALSGSRPAVRIRDLGGNISKFAWGSAAYQGTLVAEENEHNYAPTAPGTVTIPGTPPLGGLIDISWVASTDSNSDPVHYDVLASLDGGSTYPIIIAAAHAGTSVQWNSIMDGIGLSGAQSVDILVKAGDGFTHTAAPKETVSIDNSTDTVAPDVVTDLFVEQRPKAGTVYLTWTAPGDDLDNNGRATEYDIRYSSSGASQLTDDWTNAPQAHHEPSPDFGGTAQGFELTDLVADQPYWFAIKTIDEDGATSSISNIVTINGGPKCGVCHATPPNLTGAGGNAGNHAKHGFTVNDCDNCHDDGTTPVSTYTTAHQDGILVMGYGPGGAHAGNVSSSRVYYTDDGTPGGTVLYDDTTGSGGFNPTGGDNEDNGSCGSFAVLGVGGCHGGATPSWDSTATLSCAACHGDVNRRFDDYGRDFDKTFDNALDPQNPQASDVYDSTKASPPLDNHGYDGGTSDLDPVVERKFVGQHTKHLNYSFRLSKGRECYMCHAEHDHADGVIDVQLDPEALGVGATFTEGDNTPGSETFSTCSNLPSGTCHPSGSVQWDSQLNINCVDCHGFGGTPPSHVTDPAGGVSVATDGWGTDPMPGNCTYCHEAGHPGLETIDNDLLLIPNNPAVGIAYTSGGIHLKQIIGGRTLLNDTVTIIDNEATLCWGCHEDNSISEWGGDSAPANSGTDYNIGAQVYNFGTLSKTSWVGATWNSANFSYKAGTIRSTHSTNPDGTSQVGGTVFNNMSETVDAVADLRCANCHDVHNMNKAPNDTMTGAPFLRGSWLSNPYKEDGAPQSGTDYNAQGYAFGQVPRGGTAYNEMGGYFIDQNSGNPTVGYTVGTSAGICLLCHTDVDNMDQRTGENLWVGVNGHSNAVLGGTGANGRNIFDNAATTLLESPAGGFSGRPAPVVASKNGDAFTTIVPDMAWQTSGITQTQGWGYRGIDSASYNGQYEPNAGDRGYSFNDYDWGATVDADSIDNGYHSFSCSKCHNPHASRLPKLMITNCLDGQNNKWDDLKATQTKYTAAGLTDKDEEFFYFESAQNCHRYDDLDSKGGWNKVTPGLK